jgi:hypothetical protein
VGTLLRRHSLGLAVVAVLLPLLVAAVHAVQTSWQPTGDYGLIELHAMDVPANLPLFGVYSRFGFHHPGPLLFVLLAGPVRLFGSTGLLLGAALVNAAAVVGAVIVLRRRGGIPLLVIGTLGLVLLELAASGQLTDPWNPFVPMFPFVLAILLAWSVWERDWWAFPVLAGVLSLCVQAHLGYLLLAGWLAVVAVVALARAWSSLGPRRRETTMMLWVTLAVVLVLWSPVLWDLANNDPANLRTVGDYLLHRSGPRIGWSGATRLLGRELGLLPPAIGGAEPHDPDTDAVTLGSPVAIVPMVVVLAVAAAIAGRRRDRAPLRLLVVTGGGLVVGWVSIAQFEGAPFAYVLRWIWPLVAMALVAAAWSFQRAGAEALARRRADLGAGPGADGGADRPLEVAGSVGLVGVLALVAVVAVSAAVGAGRSTLPAHRFSTAVGAVAGPAADALHGRGVVLMTHQAGTWAEEENGMVAELRQRGIDVFVPDIEGFTYGATRTIGDRQVDAVLVVAVDGERRARRAGALPEGSVLLASYDPLSPDERRAVDAEAERAGVSADQEEYDARFSDVPRAVDVYLDPPRSLERAGR